MLEPSKKLMRPYISVPALRASMKSGAIETRNLPPGTLWLKKPLNADPRPTVDGRNPAPPAYHGLHHCRIYSIDRISDPEIMFVKRKTILFA